MLFKLPKFPQLIILLFISATTMSQNVGINATGAAPNVSALLDISATDKGLLIPRVGLTITTSNAPIGATVANSLLVYNTATVNDVTPGYYYWDGTVWARLLDGGAAADADWTISGVNQYSAVSGNVGIGITTPSTKLMVHNGSSDVITHISTQGFVGPDAILRFGGNFLNNEAEIRYEPGTTSDLFIVNKYSLTAFADIHFQTQSLTRMTITGGGDVGVGTNAPSAKLDVVGTFQLVDGTQAAGDVLTSDAAGNASWLPPPAGGTSGTYTPTFANVSNYVSSVNAAGLWMRTGNIVNVSFTVQVTVGAAGAPTQFTISLPVASNITSAITDLQGTAVAEMLDTYGTIEGRTPANAGFIQIPGQLFNSQGTFVLKGNFQYLVQ